MSAIMGFSFCGPASEEPAMSALVLICTRVTERRGRRRISAAQPDVDKINDKLQIETKFV
ncbi:hypothetical protein HUE56_01270 (plasmid) [Azospirillum oryzae]|uniref:Uncharacterized protein n=1 Tax=Azospirillum oryzae TaxID=286727 RepID=A0A6N1ACC7_9PROT|nr:hypothetical protein [Azospirillum oryzae]KAA0588141.1 hypothetical protein FZ938_14190 [Azospirillum oryzae]QKS49183.1 hypothetical protein HUE56_01270 [Azospirillum oryzae]